MSETVITCGPTGVIRSDSLIEERTPIHPAYVSGCRGRAGIFPEFTEGRA